MDGLMEHPNLRWMIWGYPYLWNPPFIETLGEVCGDMAAIWQVRQAHSRCSLSAKALRISWIMRLGSAVPVSNVNMQPELNLLFIGVM